MQRLLKRTTYQVNEQESSWTGFLVDPELTASLSFRGKELETTHLKESGLVREAWSKCRTIITSSNSRILHYFQGFQNPPSNQECRDLWGIVVVPAELTNLEKHFDALSHGLTIFPQEHLHWPAIGFLNLYIQLSGNGQTKFQRFERCIFCEQSITINPPWRDWYDSLSYV